MNEVMWNSKCKYSAKAHEYYIKGAGPRIQIYIFSDIWGFFHLLASYLVKGPNNSGLEEGGKPSRTEDKPRQTMVLSVIGCHSNLHHSNVIFALAVEMQLLSVVVHGKYYYYLKTSSSRQHFPARFHTRSLSQSYFGTTNWETLKGS